MRNDLCTPLMVVSIDVRNKVRKTVSEKQLMRSNSAAGHLIHPAMRAQLHHLPLLDLSWALNRGFVFVFVVVVFIAQRKALYKDDDSDGIDS